MASSSEILSLEKKMLKRYLDGKWMPRKMFALVQPWRHAEATGLWYKETWLFLKLATELVNHMVLVLQTCGKQQLTTHRGLHQHSRETPGRQSNEFQGQILCQESLRELCICNEHNGVLEMLRLCQACQGMGLTQERSHMGHVWQGRRVQLPKPTGSPCRHMPGCRTELSFRIWHSYRGIVPIGSVSPSFLLSFTFGM